MSKKGNLAKSTLILSIGTFLPKLAGFITLPILTGYLTKAEYGSYDLITILVSLFLPSMTLQIKAAAFRYLIDVRDDREKQKKIITNIFALTTPVSIISLMILFVVLFFVLPSDLLLIKLFICGYYLADIFVNTARQVARGLGKNLPYSISAVISALGKMIFAVLFVLFLRMGLLGGVIALCLASLFSFIYIAFKIKLFSYFDRNLVSGQTIKSLVSYSWPMVPNEMSLWVMNASDRVIVTRILGVTVNAVYAASTKIPSLINLAQSALTLAWQENASISEKDEDSDKYYTEMFRTMMNLQSGVFSAIIGSMPLLFMILIRGDYGDAYVQMPILCYAIFFQGMAVYLGGIYVAKMATKSVGITSVCSAAVNVIVNLALIHFIGLFAASISTLVSYIALFTYRIIDVKKLANVRMDIKQFILLNMIMLIEVLLCYQRNMICNVINFILGVSVCMLLNKEIVMAVLRKIGLVKKKS